MRTLIRRIRWIFAKKRADATAVPPSGTLTSFRWATNGSCAEQCRCFSVTVSDGARTLIYQGTRGSRRFGMTADELNELCRILREREVYRWDGFNECDPDICDGSGFSMTCATSTGVKISAHGSNAFPRGFGDASAALEAFFEPFAE